MRAIHFNTAAHHFSGYASRHPFQLATEAILSALLIVAISGVVLEASEPASASPTVAEASATPTKDAPAKWVWSKRSNPGGHLYPVGL